MAMKILFPRFPERVSLACGKEHTSYVAASMDVTQAPGRDFHGFLWNSVFSMWIWLESEATLAGPALLVTRSSDSRPVCSQPVDAVWPVFTALSTISAACTGIDYYYCIYIDIYIYILRRSKRQAFQQSRKERTRLRSGFVECPEVGALHGADTAHVMQAGAHAVGNAVTQRFLARRRAGIVLVP